MTAVNFNPRPPCGGRRLSERMSQQVLHFNPRPPCGGRPEILAQEIARFKISIHVPRVEDDAHFPAGLILFFISIHVPRVEDDARCLSCATRGGYFNPRPPCGGRQCTIQALVTILRFQSTSPVWRTTWETSFASDLRRISIHVPRVEDDREVCYEKTLEIHFNPRPPCGGRPALFDDLVRERGFQSTSPVWRTTPAKQNHKREINISIHVPRVEDDRMKICGTSWEKNFNPRPPCGGRPSRLCRRTDSTRHFNPRPPCGGRRKSSAALVKKSLFQSTSPVWRTTADRRVRTCRSRFQSTSPVWRTTGTCR